MNYNQLIEKLDKYNDGILNENKAFDLIKDNITSFIKDNISNIEEFFPKLVKYISIKFPIAKKKILTLVASLIISLGVNVADAQEIYKLNNVDKYITWSEIENRDDVDVSNLTYKYEIGEYKLPNTFLPLIEKEFNDQFIGKADTIKGKVYVTISADPDHPIVKNWANDDTDVDKAKGGQLLEKRLGEVNQLLDQVKKNFYANEIDFEVEVIPEVQDDRMIYFSDIKVTYINIDSNNTDVIKNDDVDTEDGIKTQPLGSGSDNDFIDLSRNYQIIELLKLGGINAKRFDGNKISDGDEYSRWVIGFRKHIKDYLKRMVKAFPEYNITFDVDSKAFSDIRKAKKGKSNIINQYTKVKENRVLDYDNFILENKTFDNSYSKWAFFLGSKFPNLSVEQSDNFQMNIIKFLDLLVLMYGSTPLAFNYEK